MARIPATRRRPVLVAWGGILQLEYSPDRRQQNAIRQSEGAK
jgi:hypothetical protein